jgi:hypothetical protein
MQEQEPKVQTQPLQDEPVEDWKMGIEDFKKNGCLINGD